MKKSIFLLPILLFALIKIYAQNRIVASISNVQNNKGVCLACLFSSSINFKNGTAFKCIESANVNQTAKVIFTNVPRGSYAIFVFHDENKNKKLDKNFFGIPKEGYGASLNKLPFAGAPKFEDNKFLVTDTSKIELMIKLRNFF